MNCAPRICFLGFLVYQFALPLSCAFLGRIVIGSAGSLGRNSVVSRNTMQLRNIGVLFCLWNSWNLLRFFFLLTQKLATILRIDFPFFWDSLIFGHEYPIISKHSQFLLPELVVELKGISTIGTWFARMLSIVFHFSALNFLKQQWIYFQNAFQANQLPSLLINQICLLGTDSSLIHTLNGGRVSRSRSEVEVGQSGNVDERMHSLTINYQFIYMQAFMSNKFPIEKDQQFRQAPCQIVLNLSAWR